LTIAPDLFAQARRLAPSRGHTIVATLEELAGLEPEAFTRGLALSLHLPSANIQDMHRWTPAFELLPFSECMAAQLIALTDDDGALRLVTGDPFREDVAAAVADRIEQAGHAPQLTLAHHADVAAYLARHEEGMSAMANLLPDVRGKGERDADVEALSFQSITEDSSPVVRLVRSTLYDALKADVSDIHLETGAHGLAIKYRIDGVLVPVGTVGDAEVAEQAISRIKVMAQLDIAERRVPQDGRFTVGVRGREIDFRVSIMPSTMGEDAVLRILDKQRLADEARGLTLDALGFSEPDRVLIRKLGREPYGMLLVTGPTGSGKTTTLYATLTETHDGRDKVITIEDPVEYQLAGVLQIPVNERKGLTFARGLRSILRHDPDRVMVGEIRDAETAQIAVQAALTGHLVFTTVHANNVFDVLGRFTHMEVDPYSFAAALNGIVAQRLVRLNCTHCSVPATPSDELLGESGIPLQQAAGFRFMAGQGCGQCRSTGFKGRRAIAEIMILTDELREMIVAREPIRNLKEAARRGGTRFLRDAAVELVQDGLTSLEEINRVTFVA